MFVSIAKFKEIVRYFEKIKGILREGCKHKIEGLKEIESALFYLNYEGCKLQRWLNAYNSEGRFYLNYEGCKLGLPLYCSKSSISFI